MRNECAKTDTQAGGCLWAFFQRAQAWHRKEVSMTIKEMEQELNVPRATIRYYEKENLITPKRSGNSYREYSEEDVSTLKTIIILRKIGLSIQDIQDFFEDSASLQELLAKNIAALEEQMKELEGAIKVCKKMQSRQETKSSFDEVYYWEEIRTQERAGNKFLDILNDAWKFEKKVVLEQFGIADRDGNLMYGAGKSILMALGTCLMIGTLWYFLDGREVKSFVDGFFWPFTCIIIYSICGLPLHFLGKKHPKAAAMIKKVGIGICVALMVLLLLIVIFSKEV